MSNERPAAKLGDQVVRNDGFRGVLKEELSSTVWIDNVEVALQDSVAAGDTSAAQLSSSGRVVTGSAVVFAENRPVARHEDQVEGNVGNEQGKIEAKSTVLVGQ